jgi:hypothetical protein
MLSNDDLFISLMLEHVHHLISTAYLNSIDLISNYFFIRLNYGSYVSVFNTMSDSVIQASKQDLIQGKCGSL